MMNVYHDSILEKSYCIFIDLLGFQNEILEYAKSGNSQEHLEKLKSALDNALVKFDIKKEYSMKIFTDNIVIGVPFKALTKIAD